MWQLAPELFPLENPLKNSTQPPASFLAKIFGQENRDVVHLWKSYAAVCSPVQCECLQGLR